MLKTYDPSQVSIIAGGSIINSWNTVSVELDEDEQFATVGTSGEVTRTINASSLGTITLTVPQSSADNAALQALATAKSVFPFSILDKSGSGLSNHVMAEAFISKRPTAEYAKEHGEREWIIKGSLTTNLVSGN
jgi:hypothetical protein